MHSGGLAKFFVHYLFFGTSKSFFGQEPYGNLLYQILLFPNPSLYISFSISFGSHWDIFLSANNIMSLLRNMINNLQLPIVSRDLNTTECILSTIVTVLYRMLKQGALSTIYSSLSTGVQCWSTLTGIQIRVRIGKLFSLFLIQNICCGYSKEPSQWDSSFEHPKHMFWLMGKKIML